MTFGDHPEPKEPVPDTQDALIEPSQASLLGKLGGAKWHKYTRFIMAALGSIPWVGGLIAATASFSAEKDEAHSSSSSRFTSNRKQPVLKYGIPLMHKGHATILPKLICSAT
jgi:hypothetical protein